MTANKIYKKGKTEHVMPAKLSKKYKEVLILQKKHIKFFVVGE